jgi:predicted GH43/DUF377 family glycosyl hydrolase
VIYGEPLGVELLPILFTTGPDFLMIRLLRLNINEDTVYISRDKSEITIILPVVSTNTPFYGILKIARVVAYGGDYGILHIASSEEGDALASSNVKNL